MFGIVVTVIALLSHIFNLGWNNSFLDLGLRSIISLSLGSLLAYSTHTYRKLKSQKYNTYGKYGDWIEINEKSLMDISKMDRYSQFLFSDGKDINHAYQCMIRRNLDNTLSISYADGFIPTHYALLPEPPSKFSHLKLIKGYRGD